MGKVKTLGKQKKSSKKSRPVVLRSHDVLNERILSQETLKKVLLDAIFDGDIEVLKDVIITQLRLQNKAEIVRKTNLGRQTLYDLIEGKREFNPTIKTLSSILRAIAA